MRISFKYALKILFLLCTIWTIPTPVTQAQRPPIVIAYGDFWPNFKTEADGTKSGIFYEIMTEAMNRLNIKIKWENYPWSRCQSHVKMGLADAIMTVPTNERSMYTDTHPTAFYNKQIQIFTHKGHQQKAVMDKISNLKDIKKANLTVITYLGNGWNKDNIEPLGIVTHEATKPDNVWLMLAYKRGDIVLEWPIAAWDKIHGLNLSEKIVQTKGTAASIPFHLLIGKKSKYAWILPEFDKTIQTMLKDGTIKRIIKKYTRQAGKKN